MKSKGTSWLVLTLGLALPATAAAQPGTGSTGSQGGSTQQGGTGTTGSGSVEEPSRGGRTGQGTGTRDTDMRDTGNGIGDRESDTDAMRDAPRDANHDPDIAQRKEKRRWWQFWRRGERSDEKKRSGTEGSESPGRSQRQPAQGDVGSDR